MGKGKKKDKGKKDPKTEEAAQPEQELPAVGSLAISEPSTSAEASAVPEVAAKPRPAKPEPVKSEPSVKPDDDQGGLGIERFKKKRRPKPKKENVGEAAKPSSEPSIVSAPASQPSVPPVVHSAPPVWRQRPAQAAQPPPQQPAYSVAQTLPQTSFPAPGFSGDGFPAVPPPGAYPPAAASLQALPQAQSQFPPMSPQVPLQYPLGYAGAPPGLPQPSPLAPTDYPKMSGPPIRPAWPKGPAPAGQAAAPVSTWGAPTPVQSSAPPGFQEQREAGRGRGRGQSAAQAPQPQFPPAPVQQRPPAPVQQRPPVPVQQRPPAPVPQRPPQAGAVQPMRPSPPVDVSRFRIPQKINKPTLPCRPIKVLVNYLQMKIKPLKIHRYDVSFKPDKPKKLIPKAFIAAKAMKFRDQVIAFDQMKNCYSLNPLPDVTQNDRLCINVEVIDPNGKVINYEVSFKGTGIVDLGTIINYMSQGGTSLNPPTEAIQCVDVILRQGTLENYIKAGRQFFKRPNNPIDLGDGLEMWTGLFQSAIFTSSAFVNIDVAHKGFPREQSLIDAIQKDFRLALDRPIDKQRGRGVDSFMAFIKGLRVIAAVGGDSTARGQKREFICNELVDPPNRISFTMTDAKGTQKVMTVADYFTKEKKFRLQYPNLNCMWVGPRDKKIYYPIELLRVSYGQAQNKQLNEMQLSTMVREAATPPLDRKRKIEEVIRDMKYSNNENFRRFGLEIRNEFFTVEAKVLTPPNLDVGMGNRTVTPAKGQWMANRLLRPEALESWAFIAIESSPDSSNGENIISLMKTVGQGLGMRVSEPRERFYNTSMRDLRDVLLSALKKEYRFLVIVVPTRGKDYYHRVKQLAEREVGILTQCIKEYTAQRRMNPQTAKNILLKVNSKLMGINQALDRSSMPRCLANDNVMVVGADVTHPSPDQSSVPSIAAVTASIDPKCFIYNIQLSIQTPKKEMIVEFEDMMVEHLKVYMKRRGALPKKIFVFRDGVSEGQFAQVMNSELTAVHKAYQRLTGTPAKPEVLFLLVQKRHHTRFFPADQRNAAMNVEPGTVVDTHIVHARELDFYLVSHQAIKGTARPTRYHAVCNDGAIPDDEVEQLTYYLCHLYSRCMRAVSYPTPTYYAHLACLRARSLTYGEKFNNQELERHPKRLDVLDKMLEFSRMFFV